MAEEAPAARFHEAVLRVLREAGRSKNWLHNKTGVARSTVDSWRTQPKPPQARTVLAVADVLGIDRAEALRLAGVLTEPAVDVDGDVVTLAEVDTDVLLAEIRRRIPD